MTYIIHFVTIIRTSITLYNIHIRNSQLVSYINDTSSFTYSQTLTDAQGLIACNMNAFALLVFGQPTHQLFSFLTQSWVVISWMRCETLKYSKTLIIQTCVHVMQYEMAFASLKQYNMCYTMKSGCYLLNQSNIELT